jgi:hypothetical protein
VDGPFGTAHDQRDASKLPTKVIVQLRSSVLLDYKNQRALRLESTFEFSLFATFDQGHGFFLSGNS